jgi:hypothetical protein
MFFADLKKRWILLIVVFVLILGVAPLYLSSPSSGFVTRGNLQPDQIVFKFEPHPTEEELKDKEVVRVGVYILSLGNLDTTTGQYTIDFFLNFTCETAPCDPTHFDIMNATSKVEPDDQTDSADRGNKFYYRIRTSLQTDLDLRKFPFDDHELIIEFEDTNKADNKYVYVVDQAITGIDPNVYVAGWDLEPYIEGTTRSHEYVVYSESYSRARFAVRISHPWFSSFMKGLFAAIVIVGVGMLSFLMNPAEAQDRIALTSGTLASAIFYHMTLTSSIPPVGYLTYADRFMILQYVFITASLAVSVTLFMLLSAEKRGSDFRKLAHQIHVSTRVSIPLLWVVSMLGLHFLTIGF